MATRGGGRSSGKKNRKGGVGRGADTTSPKRVSGGGVAGGILKDLPQDVRTAVRRDAARPKVTRQAPAVQPGPIRAVERPTIARQQGRDRARTARDARRQAARDARVSRALGNPIADLLAPQRAKVERAQLRAPERPLPSVPVLERPTRAQTQGIEALFRKSLQGQSVDARHQQEVNAELMADPRTRLKLRPLEVATAQAEARLMKDPRYRYERARKDRIDQQLGVAEATEGRHTEINAAGLSLDLSSMADTLMGATSLGGGSAENQFVKRGLADVKTIATAPVLASYEAGMSAYEALVKGDTGRAQRLASGMAEGVWGSVPLRLARGDFEGAAKEFKEHPLIGTLDVTGAGAVIGRTGGMVARGVGSTPDDTGFRGAAARVGSRVRPPLALVDDPNTRNIRQREYSGDLIRKGAQVLADRRRERMIGVDGQPVMVRDARGREQPLLRASPREQNKYQSGRANMQADRANALERLDREVAAQEETRLASGVTEGRARGTRAALRRPGGKGGNILPLVVTGVVRSERTFEADLRKESARVRARLEDPDAKWRSVGERETAVERLRMIDKVLESPRTLRKTKQLYEAGTLQARALNRAEAEVERAGGAQSRGALKRSKLMEWAQAHMDARPVSREEHLKLERAAKTPQERYAVSGRDPVKYQAHDAAKARVRAVRQQEKVAVQEARQLRAARQRLVGAQASRRGSRQRQGKGAATAAERRKLARLDARLMSAERKARVARRDRQRAEKDLRKNPLPDINEGLRRQDGTFLSNADIEADIRAHRGDDGLDTVAYLKQGLSERGAQAYHKSFGMDSRPVLEDGQRRTGRLFEKGAVAIGRDVVRDEFAHKATTLAKARQVDRFINESGMRNPAYLAVQEKQAAGGELTRGEQKLLKDGGMMTEKQALELADRLKNNGELSQDWTPVRAYRSSLPQATQTRIRENMQNPATMQDLSTILLDDRVVREPTGSKAANVVLVPAKQLQQLRDHLDRATGTDAFLQALNRPFRMAVLPQPRWLTGNFVEPFVVRLTASGSGVNVAGLALDIRAGMKTLRNMKNSSDPAMRRAAREVEAQQLGGLFIGRRGASNRRTMDDFGAFQSAIASLPLPVRTKFLQALPAMQTAGKVFVWPLDQVFKANRELIEKWAQTASLGKSVRKDLREFHGSWLKAQRLGQESLDQASRGLMDTPTQHRFLEAQYELLGQYGGWNPKLRKLTQGPFPFIPWMMNAVRFSMWTLPAHHPILMSLMLKAAETIEESWAEDHAPGDVPPGGLRYAPRRKDGGFVDVARYTPWGLNVEVAEKNWGEVTGQFVPQLQGLAQASQGKDPFGKKLTAPEEELDADGNVTGGDQLGVALNSLVEGLVPYASTVRRLREGGSSAYPTSNLLDIDKKPDTDYMSAPRRVFDPFRPTYLEAPTTETGGGATVAPRKGPMSAEEAEIERALREQEELGSAVEDAELERLLREAAGR